MNVFNHFRQNIEEILCDLQKTGFLSGALETKNISVEPPRERSHGDISTNAAMVLSRDAGVKPLELAEAISGKLKSYPDVETVKVAGPGFINLKVRSSVWQNQVTTILNTREAYGDTSIGNAQPINVEFVSANPTGPMHVGHSRGAVIGDVLASLLSKAGFEVTREYYINDCGGQIDILARSVHHRYLEALGEHVGQLSEGLYPGDYLIGLGQALAAKYDDKLKSALEENWLNLIREFAVTEMMSRIRNDLAALGIEHNVYVSEGQIHKEDRITESIEALENQGLVYWGTLEPPKGQKNEDWEEREQYLFRSTSFGDDVDRPLKKSDGSWTYFAADIAYHADKFRRGFKDMLNVWGADHKGYIKRMEAAVKAVTNGEGKLKVQICNLVNLLENGEPVPMSKRSGSFVTLRDVVDKVGKDVVRFIMLTRTSDAPLDFDLQEVLEQSRDNPVYYVQYAHARACSVLRNVGAVFPDLLVDDTSLAGADMSLLKDEAELTLIKILASWPRLVEVAALAREPHRVAHFLGDVASEFHSLWNKGNENQWMRFIVSDSEETTRARVALVRATSLVIASGLKVMGVKPIEEMH